MIKRLIFFLIATIIGVQTKAQTEFSTQQSTLQSNSVSIGIVLPFINESTGQSARFTEYYEGFLIALQEMKAKGFSANIYAFDIGSETGTEKLKSLLDTYEMKYLDLIIGGVSPEQIAVISDFARDQKIKYVIPFPSKTDNVKNNPYAFQVNTAQSVLYGNVAKTFSSIFPNTNIIFISENESKSSDRFEFVSTLSSELLRSGAVASKIFIDENFKDNLTNLLETNRKNIIIPTSPTIRTLQLILPTLEKIRNESPEIPITLFGHPDWQTYSQYKKEFGLYNTHIYTPFFLDESDSRMTQFLANYKKWYDEKTLINTYPKYGVLGYDTGIFFLTALSRYGKGFETNINSTVASSLQTPFILERESPLGGYMNTGFYIVRYLEDSSVEKTEYGK